MTAPIGFVGCGRMGLALLRRAQEQGRAVVGVDPAPGVRAALAETAAGYASSIGALVGIGPAAIILCLPSQDASANCVRALAEASRTDGAQPLLVIQASTLMPDAVAEEAALARAAAITYVDAPVSGGPRGGYLTSIAAAPIADFERARAVLESYSGKVFHVGEAPGQGQIAKLVNNALSLGTLALASEVVAKGVGAGLDLATLVDVINASSGRSAVTEQKFTQSIVTRRFDYGASMAIAAKDMGAFCAHFGVTDGVVGTFADTWAQGRDRFGAEADFTRIYQLFDPD